MDGGTVSRASGKRKDDNETRGIKPKKLSFIKSKNNIRSRGQLGE